MGVRNQIFVAIPSAVAVVLAVLWVCMGAPGPSATQALLKTKTSVEVASPGRVERYLEVPLSPTVQTSPRPPSPFEPKVLPPMIDTAFRPPLPPAH